MNLVDALLEPDYFLKAVDECLKNRFGFSEQEILKNQEAQDKLQNEHKQKYKELLAQLNNCDKVTYLDKTVYPVLYPGLMMLDRERPEDPLTALAIFLLQNKGLCDTPANLLYTGSDTNRKNHQSDQEPENVKKSQMDVDINPPNDNKVENKDQNQTNPSQQLTGENTSIIDNKNSSNQSKLGKS